MAAQRDLVRTSDVTAWGVTALAVWTVAVFGANVSALVPATMLTGLHASRLEGVTLNQLRGQVAGLESETARLRRDNAALVQRFEMAEQQTGAVTRRVGALEISVPRSLEALSRGPEIDRGAVTASTSGTGSFSVDGGEVVVRQRPLTAPREAPMPPPLAASAEAGAEIAPLGIMLGAPVPAAAAASAWRTIADKVGPMLLGTEPLVAESPDGAVRLVAGPMASLVIAEAMCAHIEAVAIDCAVAPYQGTALPAR
jgi:hypothetical protein